MCANSNCRNEFLVIIDGYVEFNPTVRGLIRGLTVLEIKTHDKQPSTLMHVSMQHCSTYIQWDSSQRTPLGNEVSAIIDSGVT